MRVNKSFVYCCVLLTGFVMNLSAQDQSIQRLIQGKKSFWEAKFDKALSELREVIESPNVKPTYLIDAHIFTAFVLIRKNAADELISSHFREAIKLDPENQVDPVKLPPDLVEYFNRVRDSMVGCVIIRTEPEEIEIVGVVGDSIRFQERAPFSICELQENDYELLFTREGYAEKLMPLTITAGQTDTMTVVLDSGRIAKGNRKVWPWIFGGGIVAAAGAIVYATVLQGGDGDPPPDPGPVFLPDPPDRPTQ